MLVNGPAAMLEPGNSTSDAILLDGTSGESTRVGMSTSYDLRRSVYDVVPLEGSSRSTLDTPGRGELAGADDVLAIRKEVAEAPGVVTSSERRTMTTTTITSCPARSTSSTSRARNAEVSKHCSDLEDVLLTLQSRRRGVKTSYTSRTTTTLRELPEMPLPNDSAFQVVETVLVDKPLSVTLPKFNLAERTTVKEMASVVPKVEHRTEVREVPKVEVQVIEKVLEVPRTEYIDKVVEVPELHVVEKIVEVPQVKVEERIKKVPRVEFREVVRTIPKVEVQVVEKTIEVPKVCTVEKTVEVPQVQYVEKIVEVPQQATVEKIVEVPVYQVQERVTAVPKVQMMEVMRTVPQVEHVVVHAPQTVYTQPSPVVVEPVQTTRADLFSMIDRNHDGVISRDEFRQGITEEPTTARTTQLAPTVYGAAPTTGIMEPAMATAGIAPSYPMSRPGGMACRSAMPVTASPAASMIPASPGTAHLSPQGASLSCGAPCNRSTRSMSEASGGRGYAVF
mmetsp:Transcript_58299/g.138938  ORF Transcript_58299/g.138938 Transcript_58299/m.138938 type:complete len:507 (-) Transcript_58299:121-1641(-)